MASARIHNNLWRWWWPVSQGGVRAYPNLQLVLSRPIDWELIRRQYDEMVKYATALRLGSEEAGAGPFDAATCTTRCFGARSTTG